ncbi:LysR family transcriptional regulator [Seohaeicola zhoushanensis]|uniref:LysR family transcriptional regulator n=1 Tax=Seohaeicola zhoushanensis TaxID=1569283 RepID=A0A8J3GY41_9RHOB|nr:LysR family transcriptional regulator [Seohaeicola zhoushanensis]GHF49754.1 LysR family transcriptional regulator [Seohaeicola zhoushanensis]
MDTRFLETFIVIADCGSIAEAARRQNLTPAALAQRLKALEDDLGHPLVVRSGRTVRPTAEGLAILDRARALVRDSRDLQALAARGVPAGRLRLGATATAMTGLLPSIIDQMVQLHPDVEYHVRPGSSLDLYHQLIGGDLDAALIVRPQFTLPKSVSWASLREEPLVLIVPEDTDTDDLAQLFATQRFIRYDRNQWGGQIVDTYLRRQGLEVREWLELDALDAIAAMVGRGLGIAVVPDWGAPWPEGLRLRKVPLAQGEVRQTGVLWHRTSARIAAIEAFVLACHQDSEAARQSRPSG